MKFKKDQLDSMKMPASAPPGGRRPAADPADDALEDELFGDDDMGGEDEMEMDPAAADAIASLSDADFLKEAARRGLQVMPSPKKRPAAEDVEMDDGDGEDEDADTERYV